LINARKILFFLFYMAGKKKKDRSCRIFLRFPSFGFDSLFPYWQKGKLNIWVFFGGSLIQKNQIRSAVAGLTRLAGILRKFALLRTIRNLFRSLLPQSPKKRSVWHYNQLPWSWPAFWSIGPDCPWLLRSVGKIQKLNWIGILKPYVHQSHQSSITKSTGECCFALEVWWSRSRS